MKRIFLLVCFALLPISTPALAKDGKACEAESAKLPTAERSAYTKKCLAQLSEPSNVKQKQQQDKQARCDQNAQNQHLQGNEKSGYLSSCMNANEAAEAAKAAPVQAKADAPQKSKPAKANNRASASKPATSCVKQANKKGLKGDERKQFIKDCKHA
jgi:hypothetical protein